MRSPRSLALVLALALAPALASAASAQPGVYDVRNPLTPVLPIVTQRPPEPRILARPSAPFPHAVWVAGFWDWDVNRWVWRDGRWTEPRPGQTYVNTRWEPRGTGWVRIPGHWR